jgi:hypothetical protein
MAIYYILWSFGIFFSVLVYCTKNNLATLLRSQHPSLAVEKGLSIFMDIFKKNFAFYSKVSEVIIKVKEKNVLSAGHYSKKIFYSGLAQFNLFEMRANYVRHEGMFF